MLIAVKVLLESDELRASSHSCRPPGARPEARARSQKRATGAQAAPRAERRSCLLRATTYPPSYLVAALGYRNSTNNQRISLS